MTIDITYRSDGAWGPGIGEDLTEAQVDTNFWNLVQAVLEKAVQGVGIVNFVVTGGQFTVVLSDHTLLGPYPLPIAQIVFKGEWASETVYQMNEIFTHAGVTYIVLTNHTSEATFDPGANDGEGNDYYAVLLENPALIIPSGGAPGYFLRKVTGTDYDMYWGEAALDDLSDVAIVDPAEGDVLVYISGEWVNASIGSAVSLSDLADVAILASPAPLAGDVLTYDGASWANVPNGTVRVVSTTATTIDPTLDDAGTYFRCLSETDILVTLPLNATVPHIIGTTFKFRMCSLSGLVIIAGEGAVIINGIIGYITETAMQGAVLEAVKVGEDEWDVFGLERAHA